MARLTFTLEQCIRLWESSKAVNEVVEETGYTLVQVRGRRAKLSNYKTLQQLIDWYNLPTHHWNGGVGFGAASNAAKRIRTPEEIASLNARREKRKQRAIDALSEKVRVKGYLVNRPEPTAPGYIVLSLDEFVTELKGETNFTGEIDTRVDKSSMEPLNPAIWKAMCRLPRPPASSEG